MINSAGPCTPMPVRSGATSFPCPSNLWQMAQFCVNNWRPFTASPGWLTSGVNWAIRAFFSFISGPRNSSINWLAYCATAGSPYVRNRPIATGPNVPRLTTLALMPASRDIDQSDRLNSSFSTTSCKSVGTFAKVLTNSGPTRGSGSLPKASMTDRCKAGEAAEPGMAATAGRISGFNWRTNNRLTANPDRCASESLASCNWASSRAINGFISVASAPALSQRARSGSAATSNPCSGAWSRLRKAACNSGVQAGAATEFFKSRARVSSTTFFKASAAAGFPARPITVRAASSPSPCRAMETVNCSTRAWTAGLPRSRAAAMASAGARAATPTAADSSH